MLTYTSSGFKIDKLILSNLIDVFLGNFTRRPDIVDLDPSSIEPSWFFFYHRSYLHLELMIVKGLVIRVNMQGTRHVSLIYAKSIVL